MGATEDRPPMTRTNGEMAKWVSVVLGIVVTVGGGLYSIGKAFGRIDDLARAHEKLESETDKSFDSLIVEFKRERDFSREAFFDVKSSLVRIEADIQALRSDRKPKGDHDVR